VVVLVLRNAKPGFRGQLSRWLVETAPGVFVGNVPARIRDKVWEKAEELQKNDAALMIYSARTEQGFAVRYAGDASREPVDYDGVTLIRQRRRRAVLERRQDMS
jgi:CRISPR-associated protein Cas2